MAAGGLDAGPLALDGLPPDSRNARRPCPSASAAPRGARASSLFSDRPLRELGGRRIGITGETSTSGRALRVLLALRDEVRRPPRLGRPRRAVDAELLIGDRRSGAHRRPAGPGDVTDLGAEWTSGRACPSCSRAGRWRSGIPARERRAFEPALDAALDHGMARLPDIAARAPRPRLERGEVSRYLRSFGLQAGSRRGQGASREFVRLPRAAQGPSPC